MDVINKFVQVVIILLFTHFVMGQTQTYHIVEGFDKINKILQDYGKSFIDDSEQLDYNSAFVYYFDDGKVLMSSNNGLIGILFDDRATFINMLEQKNFPVPDPPSIFASERTYVKTLNENIDEYIKRLNSLGVTSIPKPENIDASLKELSKQINLIGKDKIDQKVYVAIGIFIGEIIRRKINGVWKWRTEAGLNPYYVPYIEDKNGIESLHWKRFHEHWDRRKKVALYALKNDILEFHSEF